MEPTYFVENRYAYKSWVTADHSHYVAEAPESAFEQDIADLISEGHRCFGREEYRLALKKYKEAAWLILVTADPQLPPWPWQICAVALPYDVSLLNAMMAGTIEMLRKTPVLPPEYPDLFDLGSRLPGPTAEKLDVYIRSGMQASTLPAIVPRLVEQATMAAEGGQWREAAALYAKAIDGLEGAHNPGARAAINSALGAACARQKRFGSAAKAFQSAAADYLEAGDDQGQLAAHQALVGIFEFEGDAQQLAAAKKEVARLSRIVSAWGAGAAVARPDMNLASEVLVSPALSSTTADHVGLRAGEKILDLSLADAHLEATIVDQLYEARIASTSIEFLASFALDRVTFVAYLPHVYFYVLPMCIGDVYAEMGEYEDALVQYKSVLAYRYLNENIEAVQLWLKMAQAYLDWGDALFRQAKSTAGLRAEARKQYEKLVKNNAATAGSPMYTGTHFSKMRNRVNAILQHADDLDALAGENPLVIAAVLTAREALFKLDSGLNFYGFSADYVPPFTFEYLQNIARYFAQHASQAQRDYINFKNSAENTTFTRMQLQQNLALAGASVELENRRVAEAAIGVSVALASLDLTNTQIAISQANANDFRNASDELLELAELEAWSSAAAVDEDDEVLQTISGFSYYNTEDRRRSEVVADLARQRTRVTQRLEQGRLDRNILIAQGYKAVAQQQVNEARQRVLVAEQGREIARMRQRDASDNLSFFTSREFNEGMWYELACRIKRIARQYLDRAIEIAYLMERAYSVETGRELSIIRFDYDQYGPAGLLAGDYLQRDIDYFTFDRITTTRTKQSPVKQVFSLADSYPWAFYQLQQTGECSFETTLAQFDLAYPGTYLQKIKAVELVFVGEVSPSGIHGTLRNVGVSSYRNPNGNARSLVYPADTMLLSLYEIRNDLLVFRPANEELRLFENNGPATMWQLRLPKRANDLDLTRILDVQLVIYYEAFYSASIEAAVLAALPGGSSASRGISLRTEFADQLYYLAQQGSAQIAFVREQFPLNQTNQRTTRAYFRWNGQQAGDGAGLTFRLSAPGLAAPLVLTTNAQGVVSSDPAQAGLPLNQLLGRALFDEWTLTLDPADNPGRTHLVEGVERVDLGRILDIHILLDYDFDYA